MTTEPLVLENVHTDCFKSKVMALEVLNKAAYFNNDMEVAYQYYKQLFELYKEKSWMDSSRINRVMAAYNFAMRCALAGHYSEMKDALQDMQEYATRHAYENSTYFECYYLPLLIYCRKTADFTSTQNLAMEVDAGIKKYEQQLKAPFKMNLFCQVAVFLFIKQHFGEALDWVNRFTDHPQNNSLLKVIPSAMVLRLLIFLELKEFKLLEYQIRNTIRSLQQMELYPSFTTAFSSFFKEILNTTGSRQEKHCYETLLSNLNNIIEAERPAFGMFDFVDWAESKVNGYSMSDWIKRKQGFGK